MVAAGWDNRGCTCFIGGGARVQLNGLAPWGTWSWVGLGPHT